jgi:post-segregation antitoxin (ccd killing protein)
MRRSVNLQLDDKSIVAARDANIDLSELLTHALQRRLPHLHVGAEQNAWEKENRAAIDAVNRIIEEDGFVFSDEVRTF